MAVTLVTCSGVSSTGQLTTQTATVLLQRCGGRIESCIPAGRLSASQEQALRDADHVLVLDGCADCCGRKELASRGIEPHVHIVATGCGIEKNGMAAPRFDEIERLAAAVMEAIRRQTLPRRL